MKRLLIVTICIWIAGCAAYAVVGPGQVNVKQMTVSPGISWNKEPSNLGKNVESWTADGNLLNQIIFVSGIADGEPIFKALTPKNPMPVFKADMLPNEIMEITEATLTKRLGEGNVVLTTSNLKPLMFAGNPGFEFSVNYKVSSGLAYKGDVAGTVKNDLLYLILFRATELHYYEQYAGEVRNIIESAEF